MFGEIHLPHDRGADDKSLGDFFDGLGDLVESRTQSLDILMFKLRDEGGQQGLVNLRSDPLIRFFRCVELAETWCALGRLQEAVQRLNAGSRLLCTRLEEREKLIIFAEELLQGEHGREFLMVVT